MIEQEEEVVLVFKHLLKLLKVRVSWNGLKDYWLSHPDYLSMCFFAKSLCRGVAFIAPPPTCGYSSAVP